jgi:maltose alpha-D-glucosyltransferase / alpha-amylase
VSAAARDRRASPDPEWYRDAVLYEVPVKAFADSDADGVGDFRGMVQKLDYLQDLGVTAIWLLPFYPSPLRDDGYDIAQYKDIHPSYGSLRDFRLFMREAKRRGLRVVTELVVNHTSDQHPWFQRARRARPESTWRNYYVWSDTPEKYADARIIFRDFETSNWSWDPTAGQYFWHRFYAHQPDLNWDSRDVRQAMYDVVDYWLEMGVDGLRLDAVPYLVEREGTNGENLPETHAILKELRAHIDRHFEGRMLLAEANQWPEDAVSYFGGGDECHMAFHFPLMPRMFMATRQEDRYPIVDILSQTPSIPENCQWALFLRNHDELTLEMVTDEERDYMYRAYAEDPQARLNLGIRRRLAPLLGNNRRLIEMMNVLLFTMPGAPVIYYGDEIGMGDNIYLGDRNGVRTPMQWSSDRNAGFSRANPQRLFLPVITDPEYHFEAVNVEAQQNNPHSLLWWTKRLIALRKRYRAFGRGSLEFLYPENRKVLAFVRRHEEERILVVANLSRYAQFVELDLSPFRGMVPVELFGRTDFPVVADRPYLLTLGPYAYSLFSLESPRVIEVTTPAGAELPTIELSDQWEGIFAGAKAQLEGILPEYLLARRWFGAKARRLSGAEVVEAIRIPGPSPNGETGTPAGFVALVRTEFTDGDTQMFVVPLAIRGPDREGEPRDLPGGVQVARLTTPQGEHLLVDALADPTFDRAILDAISARRRLSGRAGRLAATPTRALASIRADGDGRMDPTLLHVEQSNSAVLYGDRLFLKVFRRVEEGVNPDLEIGRFLTDLGFPNIPPVAGSLEYRQAQGQPITVAILQGFVPNEGDAWAFTLDALRSYLDDALARQPEEREPPLLRGISPTELAATPPPQLALELFGGYLESARLLGRRTAELHLALASDPDHPSFAPEPFTPMYQRSMYQSFRGTVQQTFRLLRSLAHEVPQAVQILDLEREVLARFQPLLETRVVAKRIRCHGDYHLGQVLHTGRDFVIIDFEGEPLRPLSERRIKRSPLRDVAGMIRSFHYAAYTALFEETAGNRPPDQQDNPAFLEPWVLFWYQWVASAFLGTYLEVASHGGILPATRREQDVLLEALLLEKALYELRYELNNRPAWVRIPIAGVLQLLETEA